MKKASGSIIFRGAENSVSESGCDKVQTKIGGQRENESIVRAKEGGKDRSHAFLSGIIFVTVSDFGSRQQGGLVQVSTKHHLRIQLFRRKYVHFFPAQKNVSPIR